MNDGEIHNGLYCVADTPKTAIPLSTEGDHDDRKLLMEVIDEELTEEEKEQLASSWFNDEFTINDDEFRALLDASMILDNDSVGDILYDLSKKECRKRGYDYWSMAYHEFEVEE